MRARHVFRVLSLAGLTFMSLALASCSSAPKRQAAILVVKNDAAEFSRLADGFLSSGQLSSALQYYGEALKANLSVDNVEGAIAARGALGKTYLVLGSLPDAERELGDALTDARAFNKGSLVALCLSNLGELRYASGDIDVADSLFLEAQELAASDGDVAALVSHNRGVVAMARGEYAIAEVLFLKAAAANEKAQRWVELGSNRYSLASLANSSGDVDKAIDWAGKALEADKRAENAPGIGADLEALAKLQRKVKNDEVAFDFYRRAFGLWLSLDREPEAERCLIALQELATSLGKASYASRYEELLSRLDERQIP